MDDARATLCASAALIELAGKAAFGQLRFAAFAMASIKRERHANQKGRYTPLHADSSKNFE
jgi:hypothetical protein